MCEKSIEGNLPKVSVVIPCRDEANSIEGCIKSLIANDYPRDRLEILVVDGNSSDGTQQVVKQLAREYPFVRLLDNSGRITAMGLNIGIEAATGDIIIIASAHARYGERYVSRSVAALRASGADCVGGAMTAVPSASGMAAEGIAMALSHRFGVGNARFRISSQSGYVDTVAYGAYRREVFRRIGLFDERLVRNQDIEFNSRLQKAGGKIYMAPEILSYYHCRADLGGLWKQSFQNGQWNIYTVALTGWSLSWRHFVPLGFVAGLLSSGFLSLELSIFRWVFGAIGTAYLMSAVVASLGSFNGRHVGSRALLPLVFLVLHLSYGLGSLWGIMTLPNVLRHGH
jgi:cellulose synthase/poly-beta-1,6-N-acetylglucosamine synthase-like glycosyltransferase